MLKTLSVKNFAIIEDLTVNFNDGMTVLTGETGAGKSLIIDTIDLLLGSRADSDMIRYQAQMAQIKGIFTYDNPKINEILESYNIEILETLEIFREIQKSGRSIIKINNVNVTLQMLKQITLFLADIHVQHDTFKLFNQDNYLSFIDQGSDLNFTKLFNTYSLNFSKYNEEKKRYNHILTGQKNTLDRLEFLMFEKEELESLELTENIENDLEEKIAYLSNFDKISNALSSAYNELDGEYFSIDNIYEAQNNIKKISSINEKYNIYKDRLLDTYYILEEVKKDIKSDLDNLDFDQDELDFLLEKQNKLNKAKEKYKKNISELINYLKEITLAIDMSQNYENVLKEAYETVSNKYAQLKDSAIKLSNYRKKNCKEIEMSIVNECKELDLINIRFEIFFKDVLYNDVLDSSMFLESGIDQVDFLISLNKGEPLKPLSKTASGGELSRIMLAFKCHFSKTSRLSLMVFDEIDTGVSGQTALQIAKKMKKISTYTQVLCITHLPQVASIGDNHVFIFKEEIENRTKTQIKLLNKDERIYQIAVMLSGNTITKYALEHAAELLNSSEDNI